MSPDPFRSLDAVDPPDRWDEIARRATSDEIDVDLDRTPAHRPRRRAVGLVAAAAAAVALVAGIAVAGTRDDAPEGVTATDPEPTPAEAPDCPFHLDPAAGLPDLTPVPTEDVMERSIEWHSQPEIGPVSTWARTEVDGADVLVGVGTAVDPGTVTTDLGIAGTSSGARRADGTRVEGASVTVLGPRPVPDRQTCNLVKVFVDVPMLPEDDVEPFVFADLDPLYYVEAARLVVEPVRDAVVLATGDEAGDRVTDGTGPGDLLGGPCPFTLDGPGVPAPEPYEIEPTPDDLPGAVGTAGRVTVDGFVVTLLFGGVPTGPLFDAREIAEGRPDPATGRVRVAGHEGVSDAVPCTDLQAWVDGVAPDQVGAARAVVGSVLDAFVADGGAPADERDTATTTTRPGPTPTTGGTGEAAPSTTAAGAPVLAWEGPAADGATYRVEVDGDDVVVLVDGVPLGDPAPEAAPSWTDPNRSPGLWFSEEGDIVDGVVVGAVPPGAVATFVLGPGGEERVPASLRLSPDGRFYAVSGTDLRPPAEGAPLAVRHRAADGTLFPVVPGRPG